MNLPKPVICRMGDIRPTPQVTRGVNAVLCGSPWAQHTVGTQECQLSSEMFREPWDRRTCCMEMMFKPLKTPPTPPQAKKEMKDSGLRGRGRQRPSCLLQEDTAVLQGGGAGRGRLGTTTEGPQNRALSPATCRPSAEAGLPGKQEGGSELGRHLVSTACFCRDLCRLPGGSCLPTN